MTRTRHRSFGRELSILALLLVLQAFAPRAQAADLAAGMIREDTPESLRIRGSDALAGLGDWYLTNGVLCAALLGADKEGQLVSTGGSLVDLGFCGRGDDQFIGLEPLYNLSRSEFMAVETIRAEVADGEARIITLGSRHGVENETVYALDLDDPERLMIRTRIERKQKGKRFFAMAEMLIHTNNTLRNFTLDPSGHSEGFHHVSLDRSPKLEIARAIRPVGAWAVLGHDAQGPPIAYGYFPTRVERVEADGERKPLSQIGLGMDSVSVTAVLADPLWLSRDRLNVLQAPQFLFMDLDIGEPIHFERELRVSKRPDVAVFSDRLLAASENPAAVRVSGRSNEPGARIHIDLDAEEESERPHVTMVRPDSAGRFDLMLRPGRYRLHARAAGERSLSREFSVPEAGLELGAIELPRASRVQLPRGHAMRLVFMRESEPHRPSLGDDLVGTRIGGKLRPSGMDSNDVHLAGIPRDPRAVEVPPGRYRVYATRGLEFSVTQTELVVEPGRTTRLEIEPPLRVVETPGWIAADFHVHSASSFDSVVPQHVQLRTFAAEGGELLVATDHDVVSSYDALIEELGLGDRLRSVSGVEVTPTSHTESTPHTTGHVNVFPLPFRPEQTRGGALPGEGKRLRQIIAAARTLPGERIVQLNHPRRASGEVHDGAFLSHLAVVGKGFEPGRPMTAEPNRVLLEPDPETGLRDIDFDAMELINGTKIERYRRIRDDWFSMLRQGYRIAATANSDTHKFHEVAAIPRNYVRAVSDDVRAFARAEFVKNVREGRFFCTNGPLLEARLGSAEPGQTFAGDAGRLHVEVRAAPWIPLETLRVYVDGEVVHELPLDGPRSAIFELDFDADAFVTVEVEGPREGVYAVVLPGFTPVAFTNPIYVDADSDGIWSPPGL